MRALAPHNQQLLDFIKQHQPVSIARLFVLFEGAGQNLNTFSKRLVYLKSQGWLLCPFPNKNGLWSVSNEARPMHSAPRRVAASAPRPAPDPSRLVAHPRINKMQGSYLPQAATARRPGSDDHTRLPSLRQGQRVAFVPGYIPL